VIIWYITKVTHNTVLTISHSQLKDRLHATEHGQSVNHQAVKDDTDSCPWIQFEPLFVDFSMTTYAQNHIKRHLTN